MQHTTKYKFNLIETSDTFGPEALNANAETAERELARVETSISNQKAALEQADAALAAAHAADKAALEKTAADNKTALEQALAAQKTALEKADATNKAALEAADSAIRAEFAAADAALSQTVAANKTALEAANAAIRTAMGAGGKTCRVAYGSYTGDGNYGYNRPKKLNFDFTPYLVFISSSTHYGGNGRTLIRGNQNINLGTEIFYITWTDTGLSWYVSTNAGDQLNYSGYTYYYIAFGY